MLKTNLDQTNRRQRVINHRPLKPQNPENNNHRRHRRQTQTNRRRISNSTRNSNTGKTAARVNSSKSPLFILNSWRSAKTACCISGNGKPSRLTKTEDFFTRRHSIWSSSMKRSLAFRPRLCELRFGPNLERYISQ